MELSSSFGPTNTMQNMPGLNAIPVVAFAAFSLAFTEDKEISFSF